MPKNSQTFRISLPDLDPTCYGKCVMGWKGRSENAPPDGCGPYGTTSDNPIVQDECNKWIKKWQDAQEACRKQCGGSSRISI